jgi:predicted transcriptional regulator
MQVLSTKNQKLLRTIIDKKPDSISTLGKLTGRNVSNLSRTLKTMERYGLVKMTRKQRRVVPQVSARTLEVELDLSTGSD